MVKGISRQVIVVQSPDPKLFEQAIFILKDEAVGAEGVTNEALMKEAKRLIRGPQSGKKRQNRYWGFAWACSGAMITGMIWLVTVLL